MVLRLEALSGAIRAAVPPAFTDAFVAVTALGGVTFLLFGLTVLYLVGRRRPAAAVVGYGFVGYAAVVALKAAFALPRPPEAVRLIEVGGYGFPSGHAVAAIVVYGGLAVEYGWHTDGRKAAAVGALVVAVALSRVVLGVHYLGDVVAGLAVGGVLLVATRRLTGGDPRLIFAAGTPLALAAVVLTGFGATALGIFGACLGGVAGGRLPAAAPDPRSRIELGALVVAGLAVVLAIQAADPALAGLPLGPAIDDAVLVVGVFALPIAVARALETASERVAVGT